MDVNRKKIVKRVLSVGIGILFAVAVSAPYILFREQIRQFAAAGYIGVALACAISNISILLPSSSTLIVVAAASALNPFLCVAAGGLGTALGEQSSYICGRLGGKGFDDTGENEKKIIRYLEKHAFLTVFVFAFLPLPVFDIVGIAAGAMKIKWTKYAVAAVLGKVAKFSLAVVAVYYLIPLILPYVPGRGQWILKKFLEQFGVTS